MKKVLDIQEIQNKSEGVDKQFKELLDCLQEMPCDTPEARKQRFSWMKGRPEYDEFINKLMKEWNEGRQDKLRITPPTEREISVAFHADTGIATTKKDGNKKEADPVVFFETVKQAIENYTGLNAQGKSYTFIQSVGAIYRYKVMVAAGINDFQKMGYSIDIIPKKDDNNNPSKDKSIFGFDENRLCTILKLKRGVKRLITQLEVTYGKIDISTDEIMEMWISEEKEATGKKKQDKEKPPYTKKEKQMAKYLIENLSVVSIDAETSEDGGTTYGDFIESDYEDGYAEVEMQDGDLFFEVIRKDFDEKWKIVKAATGKRDQEIIKAFFAKDILIALKLEAVGEVERRTYPELLEPKCSSWCQRSKCPYAKEKDGKIEPSKDSCFIRYGDIQAKYGKERAGSFIERGDRELYEHLESIGNSFYQIILDNEYVRRAYINEVKNYYDLFAEELKPAKGTDESETFQFTDVVLAKAFGKSSANISKYRQDYQEKARPTLYRLFREGLE